MFGFGRRDQHDPADHPINREIHANREFADAQLKSAKAAQRRGDKTQAAQILAAARREATEPGAIASLSAAAINLENGHKLR